ncbi:hypothetical protein, partial [Escherichia coli]|uniref:hypothetical protein n=1 Tax=Escherichia coli TaxID=562 RepID=UPI001BAF8E49
MTSALRTKNRQINIKKINEKQTINNTQEKLKTQRTTQNTKQTKQTNTVPSTVNLANMTQNTSINYTSKKTSKKNK